MIDERPADDDDDDAGNVLGYQRPPAHGVRWVSVWKPQNGFEANLAIAKLQEHGIHARIDMENTEGLGLLYDTHNWKPELRDEGRERCAKYARAVHIKTFTWDEQGNETSGANVERAIELLQQAGYSGAWGIESVPREVDEMTGARNTIALIKRCVAQ